MNQTLNLNKVVIFFGFFPFVSPLPTATDLQPVFFVIAAAILFARLPKLKVHKYMIPLFLFAVFQLLHLNLHDGSYRLASRLDGSFAVLALVFFYYERRNITPNLVFLALITHLIFAAINYLAPTIWSPIADSIMHDFRAENIGVRGAGGLNPEAGFLGAFSAFFMAMAFLFFDKGIISKKRLAWFFFASFGCAFLSKSGTGYILFSLVFFIYGITRLDWKKATYFAVVLAVLFTANDYIGTEAGSRGLETFTRILRSPFQAISSDVSILLRIFPIVSGVQSILAGNFFGYGPDSFETLAYGFLDADIAIQGQETMTRLAESGGGASAMGRIMIEFGLTGSVLALSSVFLISNFRCAFIMFLAWAFIFASFSFAFPVTWLIVALSLDTGESQLEAKAFT